MTVRQLLQKQKYHTKVTISYYSVMAGHDMTDEYSLFQYNDLIYRHGNAIVQWFYIPHRAVPELFIEI